MSKWAKLLFSTFFYQLFPLKFRLRTYYSQRIEYGRYMPFGEFVCFSMTFYLLL